MDEFFVQRFYGPVVISLEIAEVDIEVDPAVFGPGVEGDMAFAEADHGGEARGREVVVDLAQLCETVFGDPGVDGGF